MTLREFKKRFYGMRHAKDCAVKDIVATCTCYQSKRWHHMWGQLLKRTATQKSPSLANIHAMLKKEMHLP